MSHAMNYFPSNSQLRSWRRHQELIVLVEAFRTSRRCCLWRNIASGTLLFNLTLPSKLGLVSVTVFMVSLNKSLVNLFPHNISISSCTVFVILELCSSTETDPRVCYNESTFFSVAWNGVCLCMVKLFPINEHFSTLRGLSHRNVVPLYTVRIRGQALNPYNIQNTKYLNYIIMVKVKR
jgi:hypothetical protein